MKILSISLLSLFLLSCNQKIGKQFNSVNTALDLAGYNYSIDELKAQNNEYRNWWDVLHYDITLTPHFEEKFLSGIVVMKAKITESKNNGIMQVDMQEPMQISEFNYFIDQKEGKELTQVLRTIPTSFIKRYKNSYFIDTQLISLDDNDEITLQFKFEGNPKTSLNAPWDGGWVFTTDDKGRPWMSAAVEELGGSSWFPNKDYWGDEPDNGVKFSLIVPNDLVGIANGRMWESSFQKGEKGNNIYTWEVTNPINNYNIIPYIGHYVNFKDEYINVTGDTLDLDYWVIDYNLEKARMQFLQVKPMISIFEDWMGPYPFYDDSYKLVEAPYLGMEHQSNIAYGNQYLNGYLGSDTSGSGWGQKFDFIIIHESGHEWFGNSITAKNPADLWIHEAFTTYTEVMYVENRFGLDAANAYVQGLRNNIINDKPVQGDILNGKEGSGDMYYKGANMIHTLRQMIDNDIKFKQMIKDLNKTYFHQTVTGKELEEFIAKYTSINLALFFDQYLRTIHIPKLELKKENGNLYYKWTDVVAEFDMPIKIEDSELCLNPTTTWQLYKGELDSIQPDRNFLIY